MNINLNEFLHSATFKTLLLGACALTILMMVFTAGIFVGYKKMEFSYQWAENYPRNFVTTTKGSVQDFPGPQQVFVFQGRSPVQALNAYGIFGSILAVRNSSLIIKGTDEAEKNVVVSNGTEIEEGAERISIKDLEIGEQVAVIGQPNQLGQINAELIRVFNP